MEKIMRIQPKGVYNRLLGLTQTQFGSTYYKKLLTRLQNGFWKESSITSFDYEHCAMYKSDSIVFNQQFKDHENHVLAENLSGLIEDSYIDCTTLAAGLLCAAASLFSSSCKTAILSSGSFTFQFSLLNWANS